MDRKKHGEIVFTKYSPLMAVDVEITGIDGAPVKGPRVISLCRCGRSESKPYCDGAHSRVGFSGEREEEDERGTKDYVAEGITVHDNRYVCSHDGACVRLLPEVFDFDARPWIRAGAATPDKIAEVIRQCPSGALSYTVNGVRYDRFFEAERVVIKRNGPIHCQGGVTLKDDQKSDTIMPTDDHCALCRCGESRHKPFCDGTHRLTGFND